MKKCLLFTALVVSSFSLTSMASEDYFNFPTIKQEFKSQSSCESWLKEKTDKYGERVISNASGCKIDRVREIGSGSIKGGSYRNQVVGQVTLDTL